MARLRRVDCSEAGIRRLRRGRGFSYTDAHGRLITDGETLAFARGATIERAVLDLISDEEPPPD